MEFNKQLPQIMTPTESYRTVYPQAIAAAQAQQNILWFSEELGVPKDVDDIRNRCTDGERHGITTVLRLFTQYELMLGGEEFWGAKVSRMFPRPEIQRMAATFSFVELGSHAPFYNLINESLSLATDEFYTSWKQDPVLSDRIAFIGKYAEEDNPLIATAAFSFLEGVVLFSNFSYLKSFNCGGFSLIPHITAGIDASAKDENQHSMASAWLFNQTLAEMKELGLITDDQINTLYALIYEIARTVYEHECRICDLIFQEGGIRTITKEDILHFIRNRIDIVLSYLGLAPLYREEPGVVSQWFYKQLSSYKYSDFFHTQQIQYVRSWDKSKLTFRNIED